MNEVFDLKSEEIIVRNIHFVWPAPIIEDTKNKKILPLLEKIVANGGEINVVREGSILFGMVELPFIETPAGVRYYGVDSIGNYVNSLTKI